MRTATVREIAPLGIARKHEQRVRNDASKAPVPPRWIAALVVVLVLVLVLVPGGCFDASLPDDAVFRCGDDATCPEGFRCATALGVCEADGAFGALCGDGVRGGDEDCDDGPDNDDTRSNACRTDCRAPACGDGVVDDGEGCDDGPANSDTQPDACRTSCTRAACGDDVIDDGEQCDDGPANDDLAPDACRTSCARAGCGDDVIDAAEACDDGPTNDDGTPDACRLDCSLPSCGDDVIDAGEDCDDGPANSDVEANACRTTCVRARCGDGVVDASEGCDDGAANSEIEPGACRATCAPAACGDGVIDADEACDDGPANSDVEPNACRTGCRLPGCGDGTRDLDEACDDGPLNDDVAPDACRTTCRRPGCGDAIVDDGENCDDGNAVDGDGCRGDCEKVERCGDGALDAGEACDDANENPADGCDACATTEWRMEVVIAGNVEPRARLATAFADAPGVAVDVRGRVFIADAGRHRVVRIDDDGNVTVVAGRETAGFSGDGQPAVLAQLNAPRAVAGDDAGRLWIADTGNHRIREVELDGTIRTVVGTGVEGLAGDDGPAVAAQLNRPGGVVVDPLGRLFIADTGNNRVRRVDVDGTITRIAGQNVGPNNAGFVRSCARALFTGDPLTGDIVGTSTQILAPASVAIDASGAVFIAATGNSCVRKLTPDGLLSTVASNLSRPEGLALTGNGDLLVVEATRHTVLRFTHTGSADFSRSTFAGDATAGFLGDNGPAVNARLTSPAGVAVGSDGSVFIADVGNRRVRRVAPSGVIATFAGSGANRAVDEAAPATSATLEAPEALAFDDGGAIVVADTAGDRLRRVDDDGFLATVSFAAPSTTLSRPSSLARHPDGSLVIADRGNNRIVRLDAAGTLTELATASAPRAVAVDDDGAVYFADTGAHAVRRLAGGVVTTLAGTGAAGFSGDGASATAALLSSPGGLVVRDGEVFIADTGNNRVRRIDRGGTIATVAGGGTCRLFACPGDGDPATTVVLAAPRGLAFRADGTLLVAEAGANRVRTVALGGAIGTLLGSTAGAVGLVVADDGTVFVAETGNDRVVRVDAGGQRTVAIGAVHPLGPGTFAQARLYPPSALVALDATRLVSVGAEGRALLVDRTRSRVDVVVGSPTGTTPAGPAATAALLADARGGVLDEARGRLVVAERGAPALRLVDVDTDDDGVVDAAEQWSATRLGTGGVAPADVIVDGSGFVVAHEAAHCVVRLDAAGVAATTPVAGRCGIRGDGVLLDGPTHVARSPVTGALFVSDTNNHRVLRVDANGTVATVIGDGSPSTAGAGEPARLFSVNAPRQLAIDSFGNLFIASTQAVRVVTNVDGDADADGDDRVVNIYGNGNRAVFPERDSLCIAALALVDDRDLYVADGCLGFLVHLSLQRLP